MTPKQHQFAREVVLGKSQADAYRSACNTLRMNDNSIRREASRLMDNPNVASGAESSVSGGGSHTASGLRSSVSGGWNRATPSDNDWAAGGEFEDF